MSVLLAGRECAVAYPVLEDGSVQSLEPDNQDIIGAQANYSCNDNCILQGSKSLRCNVTPGGSEWVNEMGEAEFPNCSCSGQYLF